MDHIPLELLTGKKLIIYARCLASNLLFSLLVFTVISLVEFQRNTHWFNVCHSAFEVPSLIKNTQGLEIKRTQISKSL